MIDFAEKTKKYSPKHIKRPLTSFMQGKNPSFTIAAIAPSYYGYISPSHDNKVWKSQVIFCMVYNDNYLKKFSILNYVCHSHI